MPKIIASKYAHQENMHLIYSNVFVNTLPYPGFTLGLENLEKWEGIFQSGKSQRILNKLEKSGKITQSTGKFREFQKDVICYFYQTNFRQGNVFTPVCDSVHGGGVSAPLHAEMHTPP